MCVLAWRHYNLNHFTVAFGFCANNRLGFKRFATVNTHQQRSVNICFGSCRHIACAHGYWKDVAGSSSNTSPADICTACTPVTGANLGNGHSIICTVAGTSTIDACQSGYFKNLLGTSCTLCTPVNNAATNPTYTCTNNANTRVTSECKAGFWKNIGGTTDTCDVCTTVQNSVDGAIVAAVTCSSASNSKLINACSTGRWKDSTGYADVCRLCEAVDNAATGTTLTCSSATTSVIVANPTTSKICMSGFWQDTTGSAHVCTACTVVRNSATGTTLTCSSATTSVVVANPTTSKFCVADGFYKKGPSGTVTSDTCAACDSVPNSLPGTVLTCSTAGSTVVGACASGYYDARSTLTGSTCTLCVVVG